MREGTCGRSYVASRYISKSKKVYSESNQTIRAGGTGTLTLTRPRFLRRTLRIRGRGADVVIPARGYAVRFAPAVCEESRIRRWGQANKPGFFARQPASRSLAEGRPRARMTSKESSMTGIVTHWCARGIPNPVPGAGQRIGTSVRQTHADRGQLVVTKSS